MASTIDKTILVEGGLYNVDTAPRYPLGFEVEDDNGKKYRYIKATAALTAGTSYGLAGFTAMTATAADGGAAVSTTTPNSAVSGDLVGQIVKVTRSSSVIGAYPITEDIWTSGTAHTVKIPEVKSGDTLALVGTNVGLCGGSASSTAGDTNGIPMAPIASGSYGFVLLAEY